MVESKTYLNYIDGEWKAASSCLVDASMNPANRHETVGYIQKSTLDDLNEAVGAARDAKMGWRKLAGPARGEFLFKVASHVEQRLDEIAEMMTREMGKTRSEAKGGTYRFRKHLQLHDDRAGRDFRARTCPHEGGFAGGGESTSQMT